MNRHEFLKVAVVGVIAYALLKLPAAKPTIFYVENDLEFMHALARAKSGDTICLAPGEYDGKGAKLRGTIDMRRYTTLRNLLVEPTSSHPREYIPD